MAFRPVACTSCGKNIQIPDDVDVAVCTYCGASLIARELIQVTVGANIQNLLAIARTAGSSGNYSEAYNYYNRVLEIDPANSEAWFGKGEAAGWLSTLANFRFIEMRVSFTNAIKFAGGAQSSIEMMEKCALTLNGVGTACYSIARKHLQQFVALPNIWPEYLQHCMQIIELYKAAHQYAPRDPISLMNIVHVCKDNIEGFQFTKGFATERRAISANYDKELRKLINLYGGRLRTIDPTFVIPNPKLAKPSDCFIVTATMGSSDHSWVRSFRRFRDDVLVTFKVGQAIVAWYYRFGPSLARRIASSKWRRALAYFAIVLPAFAIVRIIELSIPRRN